MKTTATSGQTESRYQPINVNESMRECIQNCLDCYQSCTQMISHCLSMGGEHAKPEHINLLQACANICQTSAKFMLLESDFHPDVCRVCADVCESCAEDCRRLAGENETMSACADICERTSESCEKMAAQH
jgi:hypothetical protein